MISVVRYVAWAGLTAYAALVLALVVWAGWSILGVSQ